MMNGQPNLHFGTPQLSARVNQASSGQLHLTSTANAVHHNQHHQAAAAAQQQYLLQQAQQNYLEAFSPATSIQTIASQQASPTTSSGHQSPLIYRSLPNQIYTQKDLLQKDLQNDSKVQNPEQLVVQHELFIQMQQQYETQIRNLQMELATLKNIAANATVAANRGNNKNTSSGKGSSRGNSLHIVDTYCENIQIKEFACKNCSYKTKSEASLIIHNTNHLVNQRYLHLPTTVFSVKANRESSTFLYPCGECSGKFSHNDLYLHIYQHHTGEHPYHCDECDLFFMHYEFLDDHQRSQHLKQPAKKKARFDANSIHHQLNYFSVVKCSKPFSLLSSSTTLTTNTNSNQRSGNNSSTWNHDQVVNQASPNNMTIQQQFKTATTASNTDSVSVNFSYANKRGRGRGTQHHSSRLPFSPPSSSNNSLQQHANNDPVPLNENQFKCHFEDCFFEADSKNRLDFHLFAHRNSRFKCPYCPYVSNVLNDIKRHCIKGQKHEGPMFTCPNCEFQTNCDKTFRDHIRSIHFGKNIDDKSLTAYIEELFLNTRPQASANS